VRTEKHYLNFPEARVVLKRKRRRCSPVAHTSDKLKYMDAGWVQTDRETWIKSIQSQNYLGIQSGNFELIYFSDWACSLSRSRVNQDDIKYGIFYIYPIEETFSYELGSLDDILRREPLTRDLGCIQSFMDENTDNRVYLLRSTLEYAIQLQQDEHHLETKHTQHNFSVEYNTIQDAKEVL